MYQQIAFGPSGNSDSFYDQGYKSSLDMPRWLHAMGLNAYEYSCTHGVRIKEKTARAIGEQARRYNIQMSLHAPYYINLASVDPTMQERSVKYLLDSMDAAQWLGADRVVFHPGAVSKLSRSQAMETAKLVLGKVLREGAEKIAQGIHLCPETMGKKNQLGHLDEVLALCQLNDSLLPTIDFGHLHALGQGALNTQEDFDRILSAAIEALGQERVSLLHIHFSRIEFTTAGEKKHWTYEDTQYGPNFDPLAASIVKFNLKPRVISESQGKMAEDAVLLKGIYEKKMSLFKP